MHHLCRPMAIAAGVPMQPGGPNEGCNKGEGEGSLAEGVVGGQRGACQPVEGRWTALRV